MNRGHFLSHVWRPYLPMGKKEQCVWGRISEFNETHCLIQNQNEVHQVSLKSLKNQEDSYWGAAIDFSFLSLGDIVLYDSEAESIFLLSPCLNNATPFDPTPLLWSKFLSEVENHFHNLGFTHLRTPYLVACPGVDHHIDPLKVESTRSHQTYFLPTSPEIHLKKYLCQGFDQIFEIKNCFRDDLNGPHHRVEFTMLEWYRAYAPLDEILSDVKSLLIHMISSKLEFEVLTISQAFKKQLRFDLTPQTQDDDLKSLLNRSSIEWADDDDWNDLFFRIYLEKIEPSFDPHKVTILKDFPVQQASLSQINSQGWAERFEVFYKGVELANAYLEVNNPKENMNRFQKEAQLREKKGLDPVVFDQDFFDKLTRGMPPAAGIALGLDRLFMIQRHRQELG